MKRILTLLIFTLSVVGFSPSTHAEFSDLDPEHPYYESILALEKTGTIEGYDDGTFRADAPVNRAEALKIILLGSGIQVPNDVTTSPFPDVSSETWYAPIVSQAKLLEIVRGDADTGLFRPGDTINLAEIFKILLESNQRDVHMPDNGPYADVPVESWFAGYFEYAKKLKLLPQSSYDNVYPNQLVTRGLMADLMYQLSIKPEGYEEGVASFYGLAVHGNGTASGEKFDAYAMTAAHPKLPFGTMVRVINLENGKEVTVRINDRGPYGEGRVIDLSQAAFEQISSLSSGLVKVAVLPLDADTSTPHTPVNPCGEKDNLGYVSKDTFENITLNQALPNRFLVDEVFPISGTSQSDKKEVTLFVMDDAGRQFPFYTEANASGYFETQLFFPNQGTYQLGMLTGTSGKTVVTEIMVLDSNCLDTSVDVSQNPLNDISINLNRGELEIEWDGAGYQLYKLRFSQNNKEKVYLIYGNQTFTPRYADFEGWSEGMIQVEIQGANLSASSILETDSILWGPSLEKSFMALTHHPYTLNELEATPTQLPEKLQLNQELTITLDPMTNANAKGLVITPNGLVESVDLVSPTHNPILNERGIKIIPHTTKELSMRYTPTQDEVYFMEINNEEGLAMVNVPIYPEGTYPLLPNPVDVAGLNQTELDISPKLIQLQMLNLLNQDRTNAGLGLIRLDGNLNQLAQMKADDMATRNYFSHWDPEGKTVNELRKEFAISPIVSENIARDSNPVLAQFGLMSSASHRQNILDPHWKRAGFGFAKDPTHGGYLFVQVFSEDPVDVNDVEDIQNKVLSKINGQRNNPLAIDPKLSTVSQAWSQTMVDLDFFNVDGAGKNLIDNVREAGYNQALGTLLLADTRFEDLLEGLENSPQLLDSKWVSLGVGIAQDEDGLIKMTLVYVE